VRVFRRVGLAAEFHRALVGGVRAAEDFHERALARAVFADQRVHLTRQNLQRDAAQGARGAEAFLDSREAERRRRVSGRAVHDETSAKRIVILSAAKNPVGFITRVRRAQVLLDAQGLSLRSVTSLRSE